MNETVFEADSKKKSNKGIIVVFILAVVGLVLVLTVAASSLFIANDETGELKVGELVADDAIVLNDIPSLGCVTLFCGTYLDLGYEVSYYVAGKDFDAGLYTLEINIEDLTEDNQYMVVQTSNTDDSKYPFTDARFVAFDIFGGIPEHGNIVIQNMPLVKDSDLEVMYKNGFNDIATLTPQNGYFSATTDGGITTQGFYPVGDSIEPGNYKISYIESEGVPTYDILNEDNDMVGANESANFTLKKGDTLVLSQNAIITKA